MDSSVDFKSLKPVGYDLPAVPTRLNLSDYWGAIKVRWGVGRNQYTVVPGLYKAGNLIINPMYLFRQITNCRSMHCVRISVP